MARSVLVVEDDELTQFVLVEMCKVLGFECETADNGRQALTKLSARANEIKVVLMDIHMPSYSGLDAVNDIRKHPDDPPKQLPVVAVTADTTWHDAALCQEHGFDCVLPKPVNIDHLSDTLKRYAQG